MLLAFLRFAEPFVLNLSPQKVQRARNLRYFLNEAPPADVVLVGNSHTFYGLNPTVLNHLLPETRVVSLSYYPASLPESYPFLRQLVESETPPEVIVLDVFFFTQPTGNLFWGIAPSKNFPLLPTVLRHLPAEEHLNWVFPFLQSHTIWKDFPQIEAYWQVLQQPPEDPARLEETLHISGRLYQNATVMGLEKYEKAYQAGYYRLNQRQQWELKAVVDLCENNDVALFLINLPGVNQWGLPYPAVETTLQDYDLPYRDYNLVISAEQHYGRVIFIDTDKPQITFNSHLNSLGAVLASLYVAEDLSQSFGYPLDEAVQAHYREILLTDVAVHGLAADGTLQTGVQFLQFEAIPLLTDTALEYRWELFHDKELLDQQNYSEKPVYELPVGYWGQEGYRIKLTLKHPVLAGKYLVLAFDLGEED